MHAIAFGLKRAFQATLNIARPTFARNALTAARFDMLRAITQGPSFGIGQRALGRALGVSAPTVSRMLRALEDLAMIHREIDFRDRRRRIVKITRLGRSILGRAARAIVPFARRAFFFALACDSREAWIQRFEVAEHSLERVRTAFGDTGRVIYPWHPDD